MLSHIHCWWKVEGDDCSTFQFSWIYYLVRKKSFRQISRKRKLEKWNLMQDFTDDDPEVLIARLEMFKRNTLPMLKYFDDKGKLKVVRVNKVCPCTADKIVHKWPLNHFRSVNLLPPFFALHWNWFWLLSYTNSGIPLHAPLLNICFSRFKFLVLLTSLHCNSYLMLSSEKKKKRLLAHVKTGTSFNDSGKEERTSYMKAY